MLSLKQFIKRCQPDLNWWSGCCRPTPYRLAMAPYWFKKSDFETKSCISLVVLSDSSGNWTRVTAVKGRCLNRLTMEPLWFCFTKSQQSNNQRLWDSQRFLSVPITCSWFFSPFYWLRLIIFDDTQNFPFLSCWLRLIIFDDTQNFPFPFKLAEINHLRW